MNGDRAARAATTGVVVGLVGLGILASALSVSRARSVARDRDRQAIVIATDRLSAEIRSALSSLQGIDGIAADGRVEQQEFTAFADDVLPVTKYTALAFAEEVTEAKRNEWQAETGLRVVDISGPGRFVPSPPRARHVVVRLVSPVSDQTRMVLGFDLLSEPVRASAIGQSLALDRGVLVGPIRLAGTREPGMFAMHAVRDPQRRVVGFVSSGLSVSALTANLSSRSDPRAITLKMDGTWLQGHQMRGAPPSSFRAGGRVFRIGLANASATDWTGPMVVMSGLVVLSSLAWVTLRREFRAHRVARERARRNARIALFADGSSQLPTTRSVVAYALAHAGDVLGTSRVSVARNDLIDPTQFVVHTASEDDEPGTEQRRVVPVDAAGAIAICAEQRDLVFRTGSPSSTTAAAVLDDGAAPTTRSLLCLPLVLGTERLGGVIAFEWDEEILRRDVDDVVASGLLVAEVIGRAFERALAREVVQSRIRVLADFTRALTTARTSNDVHRAVSAQLAGLFDANSVRVVQEPPSDADERLTRSYPLSGPDGGHLEIRLRTSHDWTEAIETLAATIVDLVGAALDRTRSYDEQRTVLLRLQHSLLTTPPSVDGFEVAVAYQSAVEAVGIGGDWYSVIDTGTHLAAIIGDVAGHGAEAVAIMAEVKTIARYLLTTGADILHVVNEAGEILRRRRSFASLVALSIDKRDGSITYTSAGHPPPIVLGATVEVLTAPQGPWLGLAGSRYRQERAALGRGETLLLYTDGLIEQPGVPLDVSIGALGQRAQSFTSPAALLDGLLAARTSERHVDDDIAVVAIRRI